MLKFKNHVKLFLSNNYTDMRKSIDGLSVLVLEQFEQSPASQNIFIFFSKDKTKVKLLYWDRNGFVLHYKRLSSGKFRISSKKNEILEITPEQLNWLLAGLDFNLMNEFSELDYSNYY